MGKRADEATVKYAHSLRDELRKVSTVILDEKNHGRAVEIEAIEEAIRILNCLEKIRSSLCSSAPEEFLCPLSKEIMRDPVVLTCGQILGFLSLPWTFGELPIDKGSFAMGARFKNLQQELTKVLKDGDVITGILDGDGERKPILDEAAKMLEGLLKARKASAEPFHGGEFDSYERYYIDRWLREVNHSVCPKPLSHTKLIPNKALSSHIRQWCKENLVDLPETVAACSDMSIVKTLIDKISSSSVSSQRPTAMLGYIQHFPSSTLTKLLDPLLKPDVDIDPELQSDLVKTVFYLSSHEENKTFIGQNPSIINTLMSCLKQGSKETRRDAAATFALLSSTGSSLRVLALLVDLLAQGDDSAFDAVSSLCVLEENRDRAVLAGAVRVLTKKLQADAMVDHSLSLLALLSTSQNAVEQMTELALVFTLLKFLRRSTYQPNVENALVTIFNVSERDGSGLEFVSKEEKQKRTLTSVVVNGSEHAQTMALRILQVAAGSRR
ncbi:hypothetical protein HID58_002637 [Brassica napus]|uniref:RING-type E3 ubiquitin transferase n=1 Tax=Brassica napus TaxID=3708 RepID=A0ABQ8EQW4_BRANA|nr:hypothetical protein HID58_002637 [Brassica napus]